MSQLAHKNKLVYTFCFFLMFSPISNAVKISEKIELIKEVLLRNLDMEEVPRGLGTMALSQRFAKQMLSSEDDKHSYKANMLFEGIKIASSKYRYSFKLGDLQPAQNIISAKLTIKLNIPVTLKNKKIKVKVMDASEVENVIGYVVLGGENNDRPLDITSAVIEWQDTLPKNKEFALKIECETSKKSCQHWKASPLIDVAYTQRYNRPRRETKKCGKNGKCCLHKVRMSIKDLGWRDWLVAPQHITIAYCHGSCKGVPKSLYGRFLSIGQPKNKLKKERACCMPTELKDLNLMHVGSNHTAYIRRLENLLVTRCGCI